MVLKAGQNFKLNVYFNDFGKLNSFVVPIRFDPTYVRVVNGSGDPYAEGSVVTPGAIGASTGIVKGFTTQTWSGGILMGESGAGGTYPKICNSDGWVSVSGYTLDNKARIDGIQKMFSVTFTTIRSTDANQTTTFDIADETNAPSPLVCSSGYDPTGMEAFHHGAGWVVTNTASDSAVGNFAFNHVNDKPFPDFSTRVTVMTSFALKMTRTDGSDVDTVTSELVGDQTYSGYAIDYKNTSEVYTIKVLPTPDDSSFPQVNWTYSLSDPDDGVTQLNDFLTVVEQRDTYIKVKIPDNFTQNQSGAVTFTATSSKYPSLSQSVTVVVKSFNAPADIAIVEKTGLTDGTMIYTATDDNSENKTYTVSFPGENESTFTNTAVNWKLLDKSGNELSAADLKNAVSLMSTTPTVVNESGVTRGTAVIAPNHTTFGEDYVVLRVESLYDPTVYDEVILKVHLKATELKFKQEILRLPTETSKDLLTLLQIGPENDYYETDLTWTYEPKDPDTPYLVTDGTSIISSGTQPTPSGETVVYETITVTDEVSNETASIQVAVLSLKSPIMPNQVHVENLLGPTSDWIEVQGLLEGDVITFYKTYESAKTEGNYREFGPLTAAQAGTYKFPVQNFLESGGGEIAMTVTRAAGDETREYDRVPVAYDAEPSKVYGYVRLAGKNATSASNAGIAVQLTGLSSPDPVYTDEKGYFEFKTYITPGTYTLTLYKTNYLKRVIKPDTAAGYAGLVIPTADEFAISTEDNPILLYPGDLNADGSINATDITYYVRNWVGQSSTAIENFGNYDFYDGASLVIDLNDLDLMARRNGWVRESYPKWTVPNQ